MDTRVALVSAPGWIGLETRELRPPGAGEAIVRVAECGLCGSDLKLYSGGHPKLQPPLRLGHEFHGTVEAADGLEPRRRVALFPPTRGGGGARGPRRGWGRRAAGTRAGAPRFPRRSAAASAATAGAASRTSAAR